MKSVLTAFGKSAGAAFTSDEAQPNESAVCESDLKGHEILLAECVFMIAFGFWFEPHRGIHLHAPIVHCPAQPFLTFDTQAAAFLFRQKLLPGSVFVQRHLSHCMLQNAPKALLSAHCC